MHESAVITDIKGTLKNNSKKGVVLDMLKNQGQICGQIRKGANCKSLLTPLFISGPTCTHNYL